MDFALAEVLVPLAQRDFDNEDIGINWAEPAEGRTGERRLPRLA
jgi:hypothetical protein